MVRYQGGKARIGKEIASVMHEYVGQPKFETYLEPFFGMGGVMQHIRATRTCASDINGDLIDLWKALREGWRPPSVISRETYMKLRDEPSSPERTFAGYACSFGGVMFNGFIPNGRHDYVDLAKRGMLKRLDKFGGDIEFESKSYAELAPHGCVIYCDPPYDTARGNRSKRNAIFTAFDSEAFWAKMREWSEDNIVFISEITAPSDFVCIWTKAFSGSMPRAQNALGRVEKLFVHCSHAQSAKQN
jgi:DNA adenine methylase